MISLAALEDTHASSVDAERVSRILDHAYFLGWQDNGEGGVLALWNLRKAIPGHPVGSTVVQATLERALFGHGAKGGAS